MSTFSGGESIARTIDKLPEFTNPGVGVVTVILYTVPPGVYADISITEIRASWVGGFANGGGYQILAPNGMQVAVASYNESGQDAICDPFSGFVGPFNQKSGFVTVPSGYQIQTVNSSGFAVSNTFTTKCLIREWVVAGDYVDLS